MLTYVIGEIGSGKSTYAARITQKALKKGIPVYSNVYIKGAYKISISDIGVYNISDGILIIDESGLQLSNRDWKNTPKLLIEKFKLHRHYNLNIFIFSQEGNDTDNKVRALASYLLLIKPFIRFRGKTIISSIRYVRKIIDIDKIDKQLKDMYTKIRLPKFIFIPRWIKYFNSYERTMDLQPKTFSKY